MSLKQKTLRTAPSNDATQPAVPVGTGNYRTVFGVCVFLVGAVWLVFGQTLGYGFINLDDSAYVYENPQVIHGLNLKGIGWAFTHSVASNWHPLTLMSHMLDCQLYGLHAGGHHLTSLLLHAATAILLFLVLREMTGALWPSAFVAAVFAIHPLRVESVAWVSERKDVLSGFFFMLTLWAYTRYAQRVTGDRCQVTRTDSARSRFTHHVSLFYCLVLLFFALGLMCKPMLVTVPFVLLLLDYWPLNRFGAAANRFSILRKLIGEKIPLVVFSIAVCMVTLLVQQPAKEISLSLRISNALVSYAAYCGQMFYPVGLAFLYPYPMHGLPIWKIILSLLLLMAVSVGAFCWRRKHPHILMGWLWYLGMLVPVIGLFQVGSQARADRYTYLPQIGLYILLTWTVVELAASWRSRRWVLGGCSMIILMALIFCARNQVSNWRNSEALWTHTLACTSDNDVAQYCLGNAFLKKGSANEAIVHYQKALKITPDYTEVHNNLGNALCQNGMVDEAMVHYQKALEIKPDYAEANFNLGNALLQKGHVDEAISHYQKALEIKPGYAEANFNLGNALRQKGAVDEAIAHYHKALEVKPDYTEAYNNLGSALNSLGRFDEAMVCFKKALEIKPGYAEARYNLGNAFLRQGRMDEAISCYQKALEIKPDYVEVQNNLAWVLATCPQVSLRNGIEAARLAERANQLTGGKNPVILCTLAAAYAEAGRFPEAIETAQRAIQLAEAQSNTALAGALQSQLKLYQAGIPFHDTKQAP